MPKTVLITGASRGIGRACARAFAREGMNVVVNYNKSEDAALTLTKELESFGVRAICVRADVSKTDEVRAMFELVNREFGGVDILVNNAGVAHTALFTDVTDEERDRIFGINIYGAMNCVREALPYMIHEKCGRIVNISSVCVKQLSPRPAITKVPGTTS